MARKTSLPITKSKHRHTWTKGNIFTSTVAKHRHKINLRTKTAESHEYKGGHKHKLL